MEENLLPSMYLLCVIAWVVADLPWGFVDKEINIYVGLTEIR